MSVLLAAFLGASALIWWALVGYPLVLAWLAGRRKEPLRPLGDCPAVALVVPTLNEAALIEAKVRDLARTDYPRDRMQVLVVDAGSTDGTAARALEAGKTSFPVAVLAASGAGKSEQINRALARVTEEIVVVTDADAVLEPACVRELVSALLRDPACAVVGAAVRPDTALPEERLYWRLRNALWWLEGEALGAAMISGVCYAVRRSMVRPLPVDAVAEDAHLVFAAVAGGHRVRLCRAARATEVRVPQTTRDLLRFRRRRGSAYLRELRRALAQGLVHRQPLARLMAALHVLVVPKLALVAVAASAALAGSPHRLWVAYTIAGLGGSAVLALLAGARRLRDESWWRLGVTMVRLMGLTWAALLTLPRQGRPLVQETR